MNDEVVHTMVAGRRGSRALMREINAMKSRINQLEAQVADLQGKKPDSPKKRRGRPPKQSIESDSTTMEETHAESGGSE